jgi:hypothetical protein
MTGAQRKAMLRDVCPNMPDDAEFPPRFDGNIDMDIRGTPPPLRHHHHHHHIIIIIVQCNAPVAGV